MVERTLKNIDGRYYEVSGIPYSMSTSDLECQLQEFNDLTVEWNPIDRLRRISYIDKILSSQIDERYNKVIAETSFTDNDDGKTVTITNQSGSEVNLPRAEFVDDTSTKKLWWYH